VATDVQLHLGDCLEFLKTLEPGSVDAVVTDPPYCSGGIGEAQRTRANGQGLRSENLRKFGWFVGDNMGTAGLAFLLRSIAAECLRIVRPSASMLVFMDWRMVPTLVPAIESAGLRYQDLVVWDKGSMGLGNGFRKQHELIAHFTFGSPKYHDRGTGNVIRCPRVADREHQTQKPEELISRLAAVVSSPGDTVLDPFMGSGTTGVACIRTGRKFIGCEIDPTYFAIAEKRIAAEREKTALFA
jgi:DNA modification methylase